MGKLDDMLCVVTGGARGIGKAICTAFLAEVARVVLTDIDEDEGRRAAARLGCSFHRLDVASETEWDALAAAYQGNATYDVYFTNSESYAGGPPDTYLMVWFDAKGLNPINSEGEGWSCGGVPPTYIQACTGAGETTIAGKKFHRFFGINGKCVQL